MRRLMFWLLAALIVCISSSLVRASGACIPPSDVVWAVGYNFNVEDIYDWPIQLNDAQKFSEVVTPSFVFTSWNIPDDQPTVSKLFNIGLLASDHDHFARISVPRDSTTAVPTGLVRSSTIIWSNNFNLNYPTSADYYLAGVLSNKVGFYYDCAHGRVDLFPFVAGTFQQGNVPPANNPARLIVDKTAWVCGSNCAPSMELSSNCIGEACPGSGNTNASFMQLLDNMGYPRPGNTIQFTFPDGTQACASSSTGFGGSDQLTQRTTGIKGVLFVDNQEDWVIFRHNNTASTRACSPNGNICIYTDCTLTSFLPHVYMPTFSYPATFDPSSPWTGNFTGSVTCSSGHCPDACSAALKGTVFEGQGCYPRANWPNNTQNAVVPTSQLYTTGGTAPYFGITPPQWTNTLMDSTINPYATGPGLFSHTNDPIGVAPAL